MSGMNCEIDASPTLPSWKYGPIHPPYWRSHSGKSKLPLSFLSSNQMPRHHRGEAVLREGRFQSIVQSTVHSRTGNSENGVTVSSRQCSEQARVNHIWISAIGTPLEWTEAKKNAAHVRDWGIEVRTHSSDEISQSWSLIIATPRYMAPRKGQRTGCIAMGRWSE